MGNRCMHCQLANKSALEPVNSQNPINAYKEIAGETFRGVNNTTAQFKQSLAYMQGRRIS